MHQNHITRIVMPKMGPSSLLILVCEIRFLLRLPVIFVGTQNVGGGDAIVLRELCEGSALLSAISEILGLREMSLCCPSAKLTQQHQRELRSAGKVQSRHAREPVQGGT